MAKGHSRPEYMAAWRGQNKQHVQVYSIWHSMKARCLYPKCPAYRFYGGRGISICERWLEFANFLADMGHRPDGPQLDRIKNDGGYWCGHCHECREKGHPPNCRWVSRKENCRNRRNNHLISALGTIKTLAEWAELTGLTRQRIEYRLRKGESPEVVLRGGVQDLLPSSSNG